MKTMDLLDQLDEMQLPPELDFLLDYDRQPSYTEIPVPMLPEPYLQPDFDFVNGFVPLTDLLGCQVNDNLHVSLVDKASAYKATSELDELFAYEPEQLQEIPAASEVTDLNDGADDAIQHSIDDEQSVTDDDEKDLDLSDSSTLTHHNMARRKRFRCNLCKYHAQQSDALKIHMKTFHSENKPFKCNQCDFVTVERSDFMGHLITHHKQERYNCDKCDYGTNRSFLMKLHMMTHSGEIPYKCSECEYNTLYKKKLEEHMWLHAEDRPFKCTQCKYVGLNSKSLSYHVAKKHKFK